MPCVRRQTHFAERSTDERTQSGEAAMEDGAGTPCHADVSGLEDFERDDRSVGQISQFVREEPEALVCARRFSIHRGLMSFACELRHRARDGLVETAVQHPKVICADGCVQFHRHFGDRLTDVAIVVHDLGDRESLQQEVMPVLEGAFPDLRRGAQAEPEGIPQLIEEHRHAMIDFRLGWRRHRPPRNLGPASPNDLVPVNGDEFIEHGRAKLTAGMTRAMSHCAHQPRPTSARCSIEHTQALAHLRPEMR
jgi:hypothetical protein